MRDKISRNKKCLTLSLSKGEALLPGIELMRGDGPVCALFFAFAQFFQMFRRAVRNTVGRSLCFRSAPLLRFPHTPQVYDIAHAILIHNSEYRRIAAYSHGAPVPAIVRETFRDRTHTVS
jgi:hypothetical protein